MTLRRKKPKPDFERVLQISEVVSMTIEDPERLVKHSYSRLAAGESVLTLVSNFPGRIELSVDAIDVRVVEVT